MLCPCISFNSGSRTRSPPASPSWPRPRHASWSQLIRFIGWVRRAFSGLQAPVELIDGGIFDMSPIGVLHAAVVDALVRHLSRSARESVVIRCQNPLQLDAGTATRQANCPDAVRGRGEPRKPMPGVGNPSGCLPVAFPVRTIRAAAPKSAATFFDTVKACAIFV